MARGIAVIGAGTVGGGVIHTLLSHRDVLLASAGEELKLTHVCETNRAALKEFALDGVTITGEVNDLYRAPNVDIVCELIGGRGIAREFILGALKAKKHVVTANKMLLAFHGPELAKAAADNGVELRYEAAVAGGIPIIKAIREALAANRIEHVYGILNGTCNYILSRMTYDGLDFDTALAQAQAKGFAETPPDLDIDGHDTAHKCQILASLCYRSEVDIDKIPVEGIRDITHLDVQYAEELGYLIKLLAVIREDDGEIDARVHPAFVPEDHLLASVRNEFNAIYVKGDIADATLYYGRGAGRLPTASAVVADIVDIVRGGRVTPAFEYGPRRNLLDINRVESRYYLRLTVRDEPGVWGQVATILGEHRISISSCIQKEPHSNDAVHLVIMTHETVESALRKALAAVHALPSVTEQTHVVRVLPDHS